MNIVFWVSMLSMLLVAIGILVLPLIRVNTSASIAYKESNLGLYNSKVKELALDLEEDRIDQEHYRTAVSELDHELLLDIPEESKETADLHYGMKAKSRPLVAIIIAVILPAFALLVYMQLGMQASDDVEASQMSAEQQKMHAQQQESIEQMIQMLADKLNKDGGSAEEWAMLGRSYKQTKHYQESSDAFARAITIEPTSRLYLEQAEALVLLNGKSFVGKPRELVMKALSLAPNSVNALWFAGVAEFQSEHYGESIDLLVQLAGEAKVDPEINQSLRFYVSAAREKLVAQGEDIPSVDELLATDSTTEVPVTGASLEVSVDISSEIRELFNENAVVFVYAKAKQGPKMPLAVKRLHLSELPTTVTLDDSMAMMAGMNISAFDGVVVSARVSKAGSAIAQPGDYIDSVVVDDVSNANKLKVLIGNIVK